MTRAIANHLPGPNSAFWDFIYPAVVFSLGIAATTAVCLQISQ